METKADLDVRNLDLAGEVKGQIESAGIKQVRLVTHDLNGIPRAKMVSADRFLGRTIERGHPWALALLAVDTWQNLPENTGLGDEINFGNGIIVPDLRSFRQLPWAPDTGIVFCDMFTSGGEPLQAPRQILATVLDGASAKSYTPVFGSECEFYIFRPVDESRPSNPGFAPLFGMQVWFTDQGLGQAEQLLGEIQSHLTFLKIPLYEIFNEHGGGQYEFNLEPVTGMDAIDAVCLMKIAVKEVCYRRGLRATFLGKITNDPEFPVSGYHLHQSLKDGAGKNVFADTAAPMGLSDAGAPLHRGRARARAGHDRHRGTERDLLQALHARHLGADARLLGPRQPNRDAAGRPRRARACTSRTRLPSSDAKLYLLAAVMTAAGLDGIEKRTEPCEPGDGSLLEDKRYPLVPTTLIEAVEAFETRPPSWPRPWCQNFALRASPACSEWFGSDFSAT